MSRQAVEERYRQRRLAAYREAELRLREAGLVQPDEIRLNEIDPLLLDLALLATWAGSRRVNWDWDALRRRYVRNYPDRFDLALQTEKHICGFALGKPSKSRRSGSDYAASRNGPLPPWLTPEGIAAAAEFAARGIPELNGPIHLTHLPEDE